mmetsp:Transcript_27737/g.74650  ORF Transcript_27737/g.74650 Transcript_27737/m.74650 type:complete len:206 (-) Transcript_27737:487-1104(-)
MQSDAWASSSAVRPPPWSRSALAKACRAWCAAPRLSDAAAVSNAPRVTGSRTSLAPSRHVEMLWAPAAQSMSVRSFSDARPERRKGPRRASRTTASGSWHARLTRSASAQWSSHTSSAPQSAMQLSRSISTRRPSASLAAMTAASSPLSAPSGTIPSMRATLCSASLLVGRPSSRRRRRIAVASSSKKRAPAASLASGKWASWGR